MLWEAEKNDDAPTQANGPLAAGKTYQGYPDDEDDYFCFELASQATVKLLVEQFAPTGSNGTVRLWGPAVGNRRGDRRDYCGPPGDTSMALGPHVLGPEKYCIRVYTAGGHSGVQAYRLTVTC